MSTAKRSFARLAALAVALALAAALGGCPLQGGGGTPPPGNGTAGRPTPPGGGTATGGATADAVVIPAVDVFGDTDVVLWVNPAFDETSTIALNGTGSGPIGEERANIVVRLGQEEFETDSRGLVVLEDVPDGDLVIEIDEAEILLADVDAGELIEVAVGLDGGRAEILGIIRYPPTLTRLQPPPGANIDTLTIGGRVLAALLPGNYSGTLVLNGTDVTVVGAVTANGPATTIAGDLIIAGNRVVVRGLNVTGQLVIRGNEAAASFNRVNGLTITGNSAFLLGNTVRGTDIRVTGANALLLGNAGVP
ncbi:MAG: hypothetical protein AB1716_12395 [Planctomycetota bacterium]